MYKVRSNLLITLQSYYRYVTSKCMGISMYMTRIKLLIILQFYHATGKSMEISTYMAASKLLIREFKICDATVTKTSFKIPTSG